MNHSFSNSQQLFLTRLEKYAAKHGLTEGIIDHAFKHSVAFRGAYSNRQYVSRNLFQLRLGSIENEIEEAIRNAATALSSEPEKKHDLDIAESSVTFTVVSVNGEDIVTGSYIETSEDVAELLSDRREYAPGEEHDATVAFYSIGTGESRYPDTEELAYIRNNLEEVIKDSTLLEGFDVEFSIPVSEDSYAINEELSSDLLDWHIIHEADDDNGKPTEWSATLSNGDFIWIDRTEQGFGVFNTPDALTAPLSYQMKTRFAKFNNLPELMNMFKECADIKTSDQLGLKIPECTMHTVVAQPSEIQKKMIEQLSERAKKIRLRQVSPTEDNMPMITNDGRKIGLDQRLMNPMMPDDENSKLNMCINNVFDIWEKTAEQRSTQVIFCDLGVPQNAADKKKNGEKFCVYDDIKEKLIAKGVPAEEIAFIHDAATEAAKDKLFAKVRKGEVRVIIGSTQKMGAGTNIQDKLIASHDLDAPWKPSDMEQRRGRMVRQGNENSHVDLYRYVTEGTFDAYLYQMLENKQKFTSQIMTSKSPVRSCQDLDEVSLAVKEKRLAELTAILESAADDDTVKSVSSEINEIVDPYFMEIGSENDLQKLKDSGILFEKRESEGHIIVRMNRSDSDKAHSIIGLPSSGNGLKM